ncbi:MAG: hypothetical protein J6V98_03725 [Bacteroidales bacterium]|nr:hypothetical protein [Bacteroidales bacterium]
MKKIVIIAILLFAFCLKGHAQMIGATNNQAYPTTTSVNDGRYRPTVAWLESFLVPGLGQILENKQYVKGLCMMGGYVACYGLFASNIEDGDGDAWAAYMLGALGIWIWSQIDAPLTARKLNGRGGYAFDIGGGRELAFSPTIDYINMPMSPTTTMTPGVKVSVSF